MDLNCPQCGFPVSAGDRSCSYCGGDLPAAAAPATPEPAVSPKTDPEQPAFISVATLRAEAGAPPPAGPRPEAASAPAEALADSAPVTHENHSHCDDLRVLYNNGKVFVEGMVVPFDFRITPQAADLDGLFVEIRQDGTQVSRCDPDEYLDPGDELDIHLTFIAPAGLQGQVPFDIYVGYRKGADAHCFVCHKVHTCFRATEKSRKVIDALKIELNNTIHNNGNASDPKIAPVVKGLEAFCPKPDDPAADFKYIALPQVWTGLPLRRAHQKPGSPVFPKPARVPADAGHERLTLRWGDRILQLIAGDRVQFGRHRSCQVATRLVPEAGRSSQEVHDQNLFISSSHFSLELQDFGVLLKDGGWDPHAHHFKASTHGTYLDGERIFSHKPRPLPVNRRFAISLAGADAADPGFFAYDGELWTCGRMAVACSCGVKCNPNQPACLILRRRHGPAETVVLPWKHVDLGLIDPRLGKACLCRERDAFLLHAAGHCDWLVPGRAVRIPGVAVAVEKYNAPGLGPAEKTL